MNNRMTITEMTITPEIARKWLAANINNRKVRPGRVATYARDMAAGRWRLNPQPIMFDTRGIIIDGQHRLLAIVKSGATVVIMVAMNVPAEMQALIDCGATRSGSDALTLTFPGTKHTRQAAALVKIVQAHERGFFVHSGSKSADDASQAEIIETWNHYSEGSKGLASALDFAHKWHKDMHATVAPLAFAVWILRRQYDRAMVETFFSTTANMSGWNDKDSRKTLWTTLENWKRAKRSRFASEQVYVIMRAFEAWHKGEAPTRFNLTRAGRPCSIPLVATDKAAHREVLAA